MIEREQVELQLEPGVLNVITLQVQLCRIKSGEHCEVTETYLCHFWRLVGPDECDLDLYRVQDGRLLHVGTVRSIASLKEE
jgi:hypothetical protein